MLVIILIIIQLVDTVLLVRLNKCGNIVHVVNKSVYVPAPQKKKQRTVKQPPEVEVYGYDEYE